MTGQLEGENIKLAETINIGLAISVPDGLVAPILKDVNKKDIKQIAGDSQALIERARNNKLAPTDLEGGCITVSNLGAFGIDNFIPIVVPGQCSILGIGQITDTCVPDNGNILVRKLMNMTLSVDHKVANGAYAARFLDFVRKQLENGSL
jgi:pyruvate dehydrogenase E2 component (dihydrolipoamide acetyltransferase)